MKKIFALLALLLLVTSMTFAQVKKSKALPRKGGNKTANKQSGGLSGRCSKCNILVDDIRDLPAHEKNCKVVITQGNQSKVGVANDVSITCSNCKEAFRNDDEYMAHNCPKRGGAKSSATKPNHHHLDLIAGAGSINTLNDLETVAHLQDMTSATLGTRVTLVEKKWLDLGVKLKATYLTGNKVQLKSLPSAYNVDGQTTANVALQSQSSPKQTGMILDLGPELNLRIVGGLVLSTGINVGYTSITNKAFSVIETLKVNEKTTTYPLLVQNETNIKGVTITPNLNLKYRVGRVTLWTEANILILPNVTTTGSSWTPNGNAVLPEQNMYLLGQMQDGASKNWDRKTNGKALGLNAGLTVGLGKSNYVGHVTLLR
jgi:hypothetical protein